jgi:hypothetical protein
MKLIGNSSGSILYAEELSTQIFIFANNNIISGSCSAYMHGFLGGDIFDESTSINPDNTFNYSNAFVVVDSLASALFITNFGGSASSVTGTRYKGSMNAIINTFGGGSTFLPGNASGTLSTGAQYA